MGGRSAQKAPKGGSFRLKLVGCRPNAPHLRKSDFFSKRVRFPTFSSRRPMQTVLTIAGFDPSSGAGVTADLMVFAAHGLFGTACMAPLTVQSTLGVRSTHPTPASVVGGTLACLQADLPPAGIKIGMVSNTDNIHSICDYLDKLRQTHDNHHPVAVVLDPVLRSTSGRELLDSAGILLLRERLLPL